MGNQRLDHLLSKERNKKVGSFDCTTIKESKFKSCHYSVLRDQPLMFFDNREVRNIDLDIVKRFALIQFECKCLFDQAAC